MSSVTNFQDLYIEELRDLYSAETQLVKALPKVAKAVSNKKLQDAVNTHLEQTKGQVERLEQIFKDLGEKPTGHTCKAMQGLIEESDEMIKEIEAGPLRDAAIIGGAQKIEHYEISGYGTARTFAELIGQAEHVELLDMTLDEEAETDEMLTDIAVSVINEQAVEEGSQESEGSMAGSGKK